MSYQTHLCLKISIMFIVPSFSKWGDAGTRGVNFFPRATEFVSKQIGIETQVIWSHNSSSMPGCFQNLHPDWDIMITCWAWFGGVGCGSGGLASLITFIDRIFWLVEPTLRKTHLHHTHPITKLQYSGNRYQGRVLRSLLDSLAPVQEPA